MRKEAWFGFSFMAIVVILVFWMLPAPSQMTNGHLGLLMLAMIVIEIIDPELENGRLDRHQLEYELTWCYLSRHLPPRGSVLEVGAATGRYTLKLAKRGYTITAVDMSALYYATTGFCNVALGYQAGYAITTGSDNITIGSSNQGTAGDIGVIRMAPAPSRSERSSRVFAE